MLSFAWLKTNALYSFFITSLLFSAVIISLIKFSYTGWLVFFFSEKATEFLSIDLEIIKVIIEAIAETTAKKWSYQHLQKTHQNVST